MVAIIVPVYKSQMTVLEKISYMQLLKILGEYEIVIVAPKQLILPEEIVEGGVKIEFFSEEYFKSVDAYSKLMLSVEFYKRFICYEYILIYQLDAFVFRNELEYFCGLGYDYIGAPWLEGYYYYMSAENCISRVGNGGFSLRRVKSIIALLEKGYQDNFEAHEDIFYALSQSNEFKVAPVEVALKFSFETEVKKCFDINKKKLPFGCHAWERYDINFWKPYIEPYGYSVDIVPDDKGHDDEKLREGYIKMSKRAFFWENVYSRSWAKEEMAKLFSKQVKNYIIWGVGSYGKELCKIFKDAELPIKCLIDNNYELVGKKRWGFQIKGIEKANISRDDAIIIAIRNKGSEVAEQLKHCGYVRGVDYILLEDVQAIIDIP